MVEMKPVPIFAELRVPLLPCGPEEYLKRFFQINSLSRPQALHLKMLTKALIDTGARLKSGKYIESSNGAVRWLLEQLEQKSSPAVDDVPSNVQTKNQRKKR